MIRETINESSSQKLLDVLFPSDSKKNILKKIRSRLPDDVEQDAVSLDDLAQRFLSAYGDQLNRITNGGQIEHIGGGINGDAYKFTGGDMSGMILKLEPSWRSHGLSLKKVHDRIFDSSQGKERYPMVYDTGEIKLDKEECLVPDGSIKWSIMEQLQVIPSRFARLFSEYVDCCSLVIRNQKGTVGNATDAFMRSLGIVTEDPSKFDDELNRLFDIAAEMRLDASVVPTKRSFKFYDYRDSHETVDLPLWFVEMFSAIKQAEAERKDIGADIGSENLGIRRLGGTKVQWVFFD